MPHPFSSTTPSAPSPFGTGVMPPRVQPSSRGRGSAIARLTLAQAPPVPSRDTPLTNEITPLPYDVKGHRVDYSDKGPSFFGSGILSNIGQGLGYHLLPEEAPRPLSLLPDSVYGVIHDYSTILDLGLTAGAAAAAQGLDGFGQRRGQLLHVGGSVRHPGVGRECADQHRKRVPRAAGPEGRGVGHHACALSARLLHQMDGWPHR